MSACGGTEVSDAGDATFEANPCNTGCCCFETPVDCEYLSYSWDASFALCDDAGTTDCVSNDADCVTAVGVDYVGELGSACKTVDPTSGDPYATAGNHFTCQEVSRDAGVVSVTCNRFHVCGRRFDGLVETTHHASSECGASLAAMAWMEAASVHAFALLARDLAHAHAPTRLAR